MFSPLTASLSNRWEVQMQVEPEAQVRWVLGMPRKAKSCATMPGLGALL